MNWWDTVSGGKLAQGDLLEGCLVPIFAGPEGRDAVVTQSCDPANNKTAAPPAGPESK